MAIVRGVGFRAASGHRVLQYGRMAARDHYDRETGAEMLVSPGDLSVARWFLLVKSVSWGAMRGDIH